MNIVAGLSRAVVKSSDMMCTFFKTYRMIQLRRGQATNKVAASRRPRLAVIALIIAASVAGAPYPSYPANNGMDVSFPLASGAMKGVMFVPARTPAPAVIVLHTKGESIEQADVKFAEALADEGFVAVAVNYLEGAGDKLWSPAIDKRLSAVVNLLRQRPEVGGKPVGMVGFSLGAHAIPVSVLNPAVKAVVVYYGAYDPRKALGKQFGPDIRLPIDVVSDVNAPVLLLHGELDNEVPVQIARDMDAALKAAGKKEELVVYPGAYHRFDRGPTAHMGSTLTKTGYIYQYNAAAAKDAWKRTIAWLHANLDNP